jgi:hypothetical protein
MNPKTAGKQTEKKGLTMDMSRYSGSAFISVDDMRGGPRRMKISGFYIGNFDRPVLEFDESDDELTLNVTNTKVLVAQYGKDGRDWVGKEIELYLGETEYKGQKHESVLVRPVSPAIPFKERREPPKPEPKEVPADLNDEIPF